MENRKNTVLLTVIAVATLLVAVIGATFAFFAVQGGTTATKTITVQTYTTDSTTFSIDKVLSIEADQDNFGSGAGNRYADATALVDFSAANQASEGLCYTFTMDVNTNTFGYAAANSAANGTCSTEGANKAACESNSGTWTPSPLPELTLSIVKGGVFAESNGVNTSITGGTVIVNDMDITTLATGTYYIGEEANSGLQSSEVIHQLTATTTESYQVLLTFVNLNVDQTTQAGESLTGALHLTKVTCPVSQPENNSGEGE